MVIDMEMTRGLLIKLKKSNRLLEMCDCGHYGGVSPNSVHDDRIEHGHGACSDCYCKQFTWIYFCDEKGVELK